MGSSNNTKYQLIIEADYNDGDYVTKITELENPAGETEFIEKVAKLIKKCKGSHNWPCGEMCIDERDGTIEKLYGKKLTEEEIDRFKEYVPYGENGIHTISSITLVEIASEKVIL